jgi:hypothetical protein
MKFLQKFLLVAVSLGIASGASAAADIQKYLTDGQTAFMRGDLVTAKRNFQSASKIEPRNPTVIGFLKQIAAAEAKNPSSPGSEAEFKGIIFPQIQFREATLSSVLDFMKKKVSELTGGKKSVNFVPQLTPEQMNAPITLTLTDIPFTEVLRYVAETVDAKVEYQKYAVVLKGKGGAPAPVTKPTGEAPPPPPPQ